MTRYNSDGIIEHEGEKIYEIKESIPTDARDDDITYTTISGDDLRTIAHKLYDDARLYWVIAEYNGMVDPFEPLGIGRSLRVPNLRTIYTEIF